MVAPPDATDPDIVEAENEQSNSECAETVSSRPTDLQDYDGNLDGWNETLSTPSVIETSVSTYTSSPDCPQMNSKSSALVTVNNQNCLSFAEDDGP